jgi:hypothetical protein
MKVLFFILVLFSLVHITIAFWPALTNFVARVRPALSRTGSTLSRPMQSRPMSPDSMAPSIRSTGSKIVEGVGKGSAKVAIGITSIGGGTILGIEIAEWLNKEQDEVIGDNNSYFSLLLLV